MLKTGICDDLSVDRMRLASMLQTYYETRNIAMDIVQFPSGEALLRSFIPKTYGMLFLDIYMPGISGIQVAQKICAEDMDCAIIFTTTSPDHALESYAVRAAGYLIKPFTPEQLAECLDWRLSRMPQDTHVIAVTSNREKVSIALKDILYIEVRGRASILHTLQGDIATNTSLSKIERELNDMFLRCHRSFIVNMQHIACPEQTRFRLEQGNCVPISVDLANKVKQRYFDWMFTRTWESGQA